MCIILHVSVINVICQLAWFCESFLSSSPPAFDLSMWDNFVSSADLATSLPTSFSRSFLRMLNRSQRRSLWAPHSIMKNKHLILLSKTSSKNSNRCHQPLSILTHPASSLCCFLLDWGPSPRWLVMHILSPPHDVLLQPFLAWMQYRLKAKMTPMAFHAAGSPYLPTA